MEQRHRLTRYFLAFDLTGKICVITGCHPSGLGSDDCGGGSHPLGGHGCLRRAGTRKRPEVRG